MARTPTATAQEDYRQNGTPNGTLEPGPISAARIRQLWDASQRATSKERRDYWINSAMVSGEQWLVWNDHNQTLAAAPRDERVRFSVNRLKSSSRTIIAKLLRRPLVFEVPPTSADDAATGGARIGTAVIGDVHQRHTWELLRSQAAWQTWKCGTSVLCVEWDAKAGTQLGVDEDTGKRFGTGDTVESVLDVTQVATEPGSRDIEHGRWWIKGVALPPQQVKDLYRLETLPAADATAMLSPLQRRLLSGSGGVEAVPLTLVLTYFERPGPDNKKGAVATVVGPQLVDGPAPWPFPFTDRLNCVAVRETPLDDRWTGETILSDAVPVQVALNQSWSSIVEHLKEAGNARMAIPNGAGDEWDDLSDLPGELVRYDGPTPPSWLTPPSMPNWWIEQPAQLRGEIDDILGVHDVSRGDSGPGDAKSGIAISILADHDDTPLGQLAKESAEAWGRFATLVLGVYAAKVTEQRTARVERSGSAPETVSWTGKDLAGQTTVTVPLDAVAPRSRASQMQFALALKQQFQDLDLKTFARVADLPDADSLVEAVDMDVVKARRENGEMAAGHVIAPAAFDDHAKHVAEHNNFRKSARYEALDGTPVASLADYQTLPPEKVGPKTMVDIHILGHEVDAAREMGAQLARAQVSPAFAGAAQAHEPPLAGDHAALMANAPGSETAPMPVGNPNNAPPPGQAPDVPADLNQPPSPQPGGPPA